MKKILIYITYLLLTSCVASKPYVPTQYLLEVKKPESIKRQNKNQILEVNNVKIRPEFSSLYFVYKKYDNYLLDFYNIFLIAPDLQINNIVLDYLREKKMFLYVDRNNIRKINLNKLILDIEITKLYADYTKSKGCDLNACNKNAVFGIISLYCSLFTKNKAEPIFQKEYEAKVQLIEKTSKSLIESWNVGLQKILEKLSKDLECYSVISK